MAAHTISVVYDVGRPQLGKVAILAWVRKSLELLEMAPLSSELTIKSFEYGMADFEDAMQVASAESIGAVGIITRKTRDFKRSPVPSLTPAEFLAAMHS